VRIDPSGYTVEHGGTSVAVAALGDGRSVWRRHARGSVRPTPFGAEAVVVSPGRVEQYLVVDRPQGLRTWSWSIGLRGLRPKLERDGSVDFLASGSSSPSSTLPAPRIFDLSGADVTPAGLRWRLERTGASWRLGLRLDDAKLPLPYVVDPAIAFDAASSARGSAVASLSWSHTVANQANRMLVVGVTSELAASSFCQASSVTYGGAALTRIGQAVAGGVSGVPYECVSLWYRAGPASGTATVGVTFAGTMDGATAGAVSLSNVEQGPPDASNTSFSNSGVTSTSVTTAVANSWVVDVFGSDHRVGNLAPGAGQTARWSRNAGGSATDSGASSTKPVAVAGPTTLSWTQTGVDSSAQAVAAFAPACSAGSLSLAAPASASFPAFTLNGIDQTTTTTVGLTPDDETGSNSGWNITGTSTTLTNAGGKKLSNTATTVTAASISAASGNCSLPANSVAYPATLPAGTTPPTAVKLFNAAAGSGSGPANATLTFQLAVPANSYRGTYTSTWTFAIVSGP
jgi:hypothetical protein